jgi:DNA invertase Pin-like site-specific DNA recombinase
MRISCQKGNPKVAIAYMRVSTDVDRQALGAEAQRVAIQRWAEQTGITIAQWFVEEVSGGASLDRRLVLLQAIASVATHDAGFLAVQRLDRFSRDPITAALAESELRKSGATLACADGAGSGDDPTSELIRGILLSVARFEKALIRARIKAALAVKASRGERLGAPRFGFRVEGGALVPHEGEQATRSKLRELRTAGLKLREIVAESRKLGLVNRAGKPFNLASVHALVRDSGA